MIGHNVMCNVSIIMSVYSESLVWLKQSVDSIINQDFPIYEFIIVNDNPGRLELKDFLANYNSHFSNIIILENEKNLGLIKSLNKGINYATGEYIARMDADDIALSYRISCQLAYLLEHGYDLIGSNINFVDENGTKFSQSDKVLTNRYIIKLLEKGVISIVHPTFFGKSEVFKDCYYNEQALYAEDMEFLVHASTKGYILGNCPDLLLNCRYSDNSITKLKTTQMEVTVKNIKHSIKEYKRNQEYVFLTFEKKFNRGKCNKAILIKEHLSKARLSFSEKKYFKALYFLIHAFLSSPKSFINSFKYRVLSSYYRFLEKLS